MREIRTSGSEGGGAQPALPTPIRMAVARFNLRLQPPALTGLSISLISSRPELGRTGW